MTKIHTGNGGRRRGVHRPAPPAGHRARGRAGSDSPVGAIGQGGASPCCPARGDLNRLDPYASRRLTRPSPDGALLRSKEHAR